MLKNAVSSQTVKTKAYRRLLEELLTNEEDLALMNLSLLKKKPSLYRHVGVWLCSGLAWLSLTQLGSLHDQHLRKEKSRHLYRD